MTGIRIAPPKPAPVERDVLRSVAESQIVTLEGRIEQMQALVDSAIAKQKGAETAMANAIVERDAAKRDLMELEGNIEGFEQKLVDVESRAIAAETELAGMKARVEAGEQLRQSLQQQFTAFTNALPKPGNGVMPKFAVRVVARDSLGRLLDMEISQEKP